MEVVVFDAQLFPPPAPTFSYSILAMWQNSISHSRSILRSCLALGHHSPEAKHAFNNLSFARRQLALAKALPKKGSCK